MEQPSEAAHPLLSAPPPLLDWPSWAAWTAPVKRPLDLRRYLRPASVSDPDTWSTFDHARTYLARATTVTHQLPHLLGVGILVAPPLVFVDFDDLPDPPPEWAARFFDSCATIGAFTEHSGSGTGAHAFIRTTPNFPVLTRNRYTRAHPAGSVGIELYSHSRFAALTGVPYRPARRTLNDPKDGDALLIAFVQELAVQAAPVLSPVLATPITVPAPNKNVLTVARHIVESSYRLQQAFENPQDSYASWAEDRRKKSTDDSLSAWRFHLYMEAARWSLVSPQPVYELFNPKTDPQHSGIPEWREFSGYLKKPHRVYADIQRAHALAVDENVKLAMDLGEPLPRASPPQTIPRGGVVESEASQSWAQLGLVMKSTARGGAVPLTSSVNYIRVISRHPHFKQWRIERNVLDGTTRVNRQPTADTLATRFLEPMRSVLDMSTDPPVDAIRQAIEVVADDSPYDPLVEYLRGLPPWTPKVDSDAPSLLSTWLSKIGAAPSHDLERYSRRILLGLVARALQPGCKFDYVPVFEGPTGIGKSTLVSLLVTDPHFAVLSADLHSKDAKIQLRGKWGLELAEMSAFKKSDEETRKVFFSTAFDSFRPPYGRASIDVMRRCILFGTTEDKQYLSDHRGNRRYWPILFTKQIGTDWVKAFRDELFAEALYYFEKGEAFHDTMEEFNAPERKAALDERLVTPAWQMKLLDHLRALPIPRLPTPEDQGFSGVVTTQYVASLHRTLDLPNVLLNMSDAQLAGFLRRADFHSRTLSYRARGGSRKTYCWAHSAFLRLTDEQCRAFWSNFPALFLDNTVPPAWHELQADHLEFALRHLNGDPNVG